MNTAASGIRLDKLVIVTNDMEPEAYTLSIETEENGALKLLHVDYPGEPTSLYNLQQIKKGVVLLRRDKRDIVTLQGPNLDPLAGGKVTVRYLYSGVTGKRKTSNFQIIPQDGKWVMTTKSSNIVVTKLHFTLKKWLGKVIGLDKLLVNPK